jgi:hypothetical protein
MDFLSEVGKKTSKVLTSPDVKIVYITKMAALFLFEFYRQSKG